MNKMMFAIALLGGGWLFAADPPKPAASELTPAQKLELADKLKAVITAQRDAMFLLKTSYEYQINAKTADDKSVQLQSEVKDLTDKYLVGLKLDPKLYLIDDKYLIVKKEPAKP